jgi:signal transduction histidine kinase
MLAMRARTATVAVITVAVALALAGEVVQLWAAVADDRSFPTAAMNASPVLAFAVVGAVVAASRPRNAIGWLVLAAGAAWAAGGAAVDAAYHGIVASPGSVAGASLLAVTGSATRSVGWYLITIAVPVLYPTGHVLSERWRWLKPAIVIILVTAVIDPVTDARADLTDFGDWHNPFDLGAVGRQIISPLAFLGHIAFGAVVTVAAVLQLVQRWRRGDALTRQQVGMFAGAVALTIVAAPLALVAGAGGWVFGLAALPLPITIGFAVLARGLYDLRTAANRTMVWTALSATVAGAYALVIGGVGGLLHADRHASWLPWVAAAVIAILFAPLREGLQHGVNRLTYGRWDEPYDVLAALGQRVAATADVDRLLGDVVSELTGLGLRGVRILDGGGAVVAGQHEASRDEVEQPLAAYGEVVGTLRYEQPTTPLRARDRQLLDDLGGHLGGLLHAHRLTHDLQAARERLVLAREEERRRLRRDLHDGLGPALAGHLLRLDLLATRIRPDRQALAEVDSLRQDLRATVVEVRRVVEGLRPPALDELGLAGAVQQLAERLLAGSPTCVTVDAEGLPLLSAAVEVAAFRIATEAVTNVAKHSCASTCRITLRPERGVLVVEVADDGLGTETPPATGGHGMHTMRERAEELRGRLRVSHPPGGGTTVIAELPLPLPRGQQEPAARASAAR